ncbi:hypothetical protein Runsl_1997 [Runella slithyformis DSM 19594]|uniref:Uncharacterized protein n=1 Tax=Runella slithyformis (strain ATCC 29530 / DSM 19594 / LMG 11500 / NCIMB 11436 / LSU 4) TaxID=761193 RepID=A0A7U4E5J9_RUNSL|nr:hypothetical protein Runsl_1997 [Runella slithyformis DSM 19594]
MYVNVEVLIYIALNAEKEAKISQNKMKLITILKIYLQGSFNQ